MAYTTINIDTKQIDQLSKELKGFDKEVAKATALALNRTVDHVYTQVGRIIPKAYQIKPSEVKGSLSKNKPSKTNLTASVESRGHVLSMAHFPFTPKTARRKKQSPSGVPVMATIKKGQRVLLGKGFVASTGAKSQDKVSVNVFKRTGKSRFPIETIKTLSIPQMITNANVAEQIQQSAQAKLDERLDHEITRLMTSMDKNIRRK